MAQAISIFTNLSRKSMQPDLRNILSDLIVFFWGVGDWGLNLQPLTCQAGACAIELNPWIPRLHSLELGSWMKVIRYDFLSLPMAY